MRRRSKGRVGARSPVRGRTSAPPVGCCFDPGDLERALDALDFVFQDEEMAPGEFRFRQGRLLERLHERGISRALGLALLEDLLTRGVFHADKAFANLQIFVRLDGEQTDCATPDRYLRTTSESWWTYRAQSKAERARPSAARPTRPWPTQRKGRDRQLEARDRWIYQKCCRRLAYKTIQRELSRLCQEKGWRKIASIQGIRAAARTYAQRHALPIPASRQNL